MSETPAKKLGMIRTVTTELTATMRVRAGLLRPEQRESKTWRVLDSKELLKSLRVIQASTVEKHTKENLDILIDQLIDARTDV